MMTTGGAPAQPTLVAQLRKLQSAIAQAGQAGLIDEECAIDVTPPGKKPSAWPTKPPRLAGDPGAPRHCQG